MSKDKKKARVSVKQTMSYDETVSFLDDLVQSFKDKELTINDSEEAITLTPADSFKVEVKAGLKKDKSKIKMEISWHGSSEKDSSDESETENKDGKQDNDS